MTSRPIRRFAEVLGLLDRGEFEAACDRALEEALSALESTPKEKGSATLTVELKIDFDSGRVDVKPAIKSKLPVGDAFGRTPFWSIDGALSTQHPSQIDMFARAVDPVAAAAK